MPFVKLVVSMTLILSGANARGQELSGHELRRQLLSDEQLVANPKQPTIALLSDAQAAMGYVRGVSDALAIGLPSCQPLNASPGQKMAIIRKFMHEHPESWSEPAVAVVLTALKSAFGCNAK